MYNNIFEAQKTVFLAAFALVSNPDTWCQGNYALDEYGNDVASWNNTACKWCSVGAVTKANMAGSEILLSSLVKFLRMNYGTDSIIDFNDSHTHAEVVDMWRTYGNLQGFFD